MTELEESVDRVQRELFLAYQEEIGCYTEIDEEVMHQESYDGRQIREAMEVIDKYAER